VSLNIDIDLFNAPCGIVSIDYRDFLGQIYDDIQIERIPLNKDGQETPVRKIKILIFIA